MFLAFAWSTCYPSGGLHDLVGKADEYVDALEMIKTAEGEKAEIWQFADNGSITRVGFYSRPMGGAHWERVFGALE